MAQLKDTIVSGNLRVTDTTLTDTLQVTTIKAPTSSGGSTYGPGTSGQVLKSDGTTVYWGSDSNSVTGVKGNAESSYRTGNVNLTPANIGALASTTKYAASSSVGGPALSVSTAGGDVVLGTSGSSSDDSGDIYWTYGNGQEKARLYLSNTYTAKEGPLYRIFKSDGTGLYSGRLPLADGTSASGTWGISITGNASTSTKATQDGDGNTISSTYLKLSGGTMTGTIRGTYSNTHIALADGGIGDYATLDHKNNINISSWNGVSISNGCSSVGTLDQVTFSVNARTGATQQRGDATIGGNITITRYGSLIQKQDSGSNWTPAIKWWSGGTDPGNYGPCIAQHNTGGDDSTYPGSITILPYHTTDQPWYGTVGLFIKKDHVYIDGVELFKSTGGTMEGNISFKSISGDTYPIASNKIIWNGGSDGIDIYYNLRSDDAGELIMNMRDDTNVRISFAYMGTVKSYIDTNGNFSGNAATSSSWTTARTLTLGGQLTGSVSVKGNANMTLNGYLDRAFIYDDNAVPSGHTWAEYAWHKFAEVTITDEFEDRVITFLVSRTHGSSAEYTGILSAKLRTKENKVYDSAQLKWLVRNYGLSKDDFVMVYTSTSGTSTKAELWCRLPGQYHGLVFTVLKEHRRNLSASSDWTLVDTPKGSSTHGSSSYPTTGITDTIISSDGIITNSTTGTATSANALNLTHDNELNFSKLASTGHVWFGYRWNTQGTETSGGTTITKYKFGNANGAQGLAGIEAKELTVAESIYLNSKNASLYIQDSTSTQFALIDYNGSNLWIGTSGRTDYRHNGNTIISTGWTGTLPTTAGSSLTGNSSIYVSIPTYTVNENGTGSWTHNSAEVLHERNYTSYTYSATTSRTKNTVLAAPNGSNGTASFRKLVAEDLPTMGGATADTAGTAGIVPAPAAGSQSLFLRGNGTWATPSNNRVAYSLNQTTKAYLMACTNAPASSSSNRAAVGDTEVYLDTAVGSLHANIFEAGKASTTDGEIKFYRSGSGNDGETTLKATAQSTSGTYLLPARGNLQYTLSCGHEDLSAPTGSLSAANVLVPSYTKFIKIVFKSDSSSTLYSMVEIPYFGNGDYSALVQVGTFGDNQGSLRIVMKAIIIQITDGTQTGRKSFTITGSPTTKINGSSVSDYTRSITIHKIYAVD